MTFADLKKHIDSLTPEQLARPVTILRHDDFCPAMLLLVTERWQEDGSLDEQDGADVRVGDWLLMADNSWSSDRFED